MYFLSAMICIAHKIRKKRTNVIKNGGKKKHLYKVHCQKKLVILANKLLKKSLLEVGNAYWLFSSFAAKRLSYFLLFTYIPPLFLFLSIHNFCHLAVVSVFILQLLFIWLIIHKKVIFSPNIFYTSPHPTTILISYHKNLPNFLYWMTYGNVLNINSDRFTLPPL